MMATVAALLLFSDLNETLIRRVKDDTVRKGFENAVAKNLIPAASELVYPGHFTINADGGGFGPDTTWPGLDSWQMAGAYLELGRVQIVKDYFDFVCASQRKDGNIPFAIFDGETKGGGGCLRGMKWPDDVFEYKPPVRPGAPESSQQTRKWVGLYTHWELESNPLSVLGPVCHLMTAAEIYAATKDKKWLSDHLSSIERAADYIKTQISSNGLISGSGFYTERPPRWGWDGVTQCYGVHALRGLASLHAALGDKEAAKKWKDAADSLAKRFLEQFWKEDHFAEYIHISHGVVDSHGLSDTNWAAVGLGIVKGERAKSLYNKLTSDQAWWPGGMPTITVTKPGTYEDWEHEHVPFDGAPGLVNDVASMGRTWYVEALACKRMGDSKRLIESAKRVAEHADDGYWRERYHPTAEGSQPAGCYKYCEYAAVFVRVVLENKKVFLK